MRQHLLPRCDPFEVSQEPYLTYAKLRAEGPLLRGGPGIFVVTRYKEVAALLGENKLGGFRFQAPNYPFAKPPSERTEVDDPTGSFLQRIVVATEGSDHLRMRRILANSLMRRVTPALDNVISDCVDELLEVPAEQGTLEAVGQLAYPLPLMVVSHLFGIPVADRDLVGCKTLKLSKVFAPLVAVNDRIAANDAVCWLREYFESLLNKRIAAPGDDIMSALAVAIVSGMSTRLEAIDNAIFMVFAGLETSMTLTAAGCAALSQFPKEMAKLRYDESLVPNAIEEFLRFEAPTQITARTVLEPIEVSGNWLTKGRIVLLLLGSANRDERQFENPELLDVGRHPNPHVSFGSGAHHCLGATLARMMSKTVFEKLSRRFGVFESAGDVVCEPSVTPRIYSRVPIRVRVG